MVKILQWFLLFWSWVILQDELFVKSVAPVQERKIHYRRQGHSNIADQVLPTRLAFLVDL